MDNIERNDFSYVIRKCVVEEKVGIKVYLLMPCFVHELAHG